MANVARRRVIVLAALVATCAAAGPSTQPSTQRIRDTVEYLASDALEGRRPGTKGIDLARDYIVQQCTQAGLKPLPGSKGLLQPFELTEVTGLGAGTKLRIGDLGLGAFKDYIPLGTSAEGSFDAGIVFAGYGITRKDYDDYAGIDAKGKVVLAFRFEPHDANGHSRFAGATWSDDARLGTKARNAAAHGAVALLLVTPPRYHAGSDDLPNPGSEFSEPTAKIPVVQLTQAAADKVLAAAKAPALGELQTSIDEKGRPHSLAIDAMAAGTVKLERTAFALSNIAGVLPGAGALADQYIVVGAHYDHLGHGPSTRGTIIYHGADDNASGSAAVVELARLISADPPAGDRRGIIFICFSGEERGLIGSQYFVEHPPVELAKISAMINFDMVGRMREDILFVLGQGLSPTFPPAVRVAAAGSRLNVREGFTSGLAPSDHMSFIYRDIPSLYFFTGNHADMHRPTDTADRINFAGEAAAVEVARRVIVDLATTPNIEPVPAELRRTKP